MLNEGNSKDVIFELSLGTPDAEDMIHNINVQEVGGDFHTVIGITEYFRLLFRKVDVMKFDGTIYSDNSFSIKAQKKC